ncbi:pilus assembly protein TadG-related protein [Specibacter sp. RAF43]|uniref:pilus assembly protein TadG-related protein n=1 Tax=Specibacter sp. RAF43 TaxID=3233057 RepID=UPI003F9E36C7
MRRLKGLRRIDGPDNERGASAIMVALLMVALLGFAAICVDVGMMYAERAQLQNGADSASLAVANDCASARTCGDALTTAGTYANANANDGAARTNSVTFPTTNSVQVDVSSRDGAGNNFIRLAFANIFGIGTADVGATATAAWGPPTAGTALPWTFGKCVFDQSLTAAQKAELEATGNFTGNPDSARVLLRSDQNANYPGCTAALGFPTGGFGWLDIEGGQCQATIDVGTGKAGSSPGNNFPGVCAAVMPTLLTKPILVPIFSTSSTTGGQHATYQIYGFAAFQVTGWKFNPNNHADSLAPSCTGNCRGLFGYFTRFVSLQEGLVPGTGPNLGGSIVRLIK